MVVHARWMNHSVNGSGNIKFLLEVNIQQPKEPPNTCGHQSFQWVGETSIMVSLKFDREQLARCFIFHLTNHIDEIFFQENLCRLRNPKAINRKFKLNTNLVFVYTHLWCCVGKQFLLFWIYLPNNRLRLILTCGSQVSLQIFH